MNREYLIVGLILVLILGLGYVDNKTQKTGIENGTEITETSKPSVHATPDIISTKENDRPIITNENDRKFLEWARNSMMTLNADVKNMSDAASSRNEILGETSAKTLKDDSKNYLDQIDEFSVSSNIKDTFNEYKATLEDFYQAGKYAEQGAKNKDPNDMQTAQDYMTKASEHINSMATLDKNLEPK